MKDLLKDFDVKKTLRQLSDESRWSLLKYIGLEDAILQQLTSSEHRTKTKRIDEIADLLAGSPEHIARAYRLLRIIAFFHHHRAILSELVDYVCTKSSSPIDNTALEACLSEADQVTTLLIHDETSVREYFLIAQHTQQSNRYWKFRSDYYEEGSTVDETSLETIKYDLIASLKQEGRGSECHIQQFTHENKEFYFFDLEDSPMLAREWENKQVNERFTRPVMEIAMVIDRTSGGINILAPNAKTRATMHAICAKTIFQQETIPVHAPDNDVYDLEALLDSILQRDGIHVVHPEAFTIQQVYINQLRIQQRSFPFWELTLNLRIPAKKATEDHRSDMTQMLKSLMWKGEDKGYGWQLSNIKATKANMVAVFLDLNEKKLISQAFAISAKGESNLQHSAQDEAIKHYLRAAGLLLTKQDNDTVKQVAHG